MTRNAAPDPGRSIVADTCSCSKATWRTFGRPSPEHTAHPRHARTLISCRPTHKCFTVPGTRPTPSHVCRPASALSTQPAARSALPALLQSDPGRHRLGCPGTRAGRPRDGRLRPAQPQLGRLLRARLPDEAVWTAGDPLRQRPRVVGAQPDGQGLAERHLSIAQPHPRRRAAWRAVRRRCRRVVPEAATERARRGSGGERRAWAQTGRRPGSSADRAAASAPRADPARPAAVHVDEAARHARHAHARHRARPARMGEPGAHHRAVSVQLPARRAQGRRTGERGRVPAQLPRRERHGADQPPHLHDTTAPGARAPLRDGAGRQVPRARPAS